MHVGHVLAGRLTEHNDLALCQETGIVDPMPV